MENPNKKKNGGDGTFVGNALRWIVSNGQTIAPEILNVAGTITGIDSLNKLGDMIRGDESLSQSDKDVILRELDKDISAEKQITRRWESDNKQSHWLPRLIRPLTLAFLVVSTVLLIFIEGGVIEFNVKSNWIDLLQLVLITVIGAYFGGRSIEKVKRK